MPWQGVNVYIMSREGCGQLLLRSFRGASARDATCEHLAWQGVNGQGRAPPYTPGPLTVTSMRNSSPRRPPDATRLCTGPTARLVT